MYHLNNKIKSNLIKIYNQIKIKKLHNLFVSIVNMKIKQKIQNKRVSVTNAKNILINDF
jgi:hypothetical protein